MRILDVTARAGGLAVVWFVVSEGRTEYWYYGVITVAAALAVSLATRPPRAVSFPSLRQLWAALSFAGWMATSAVVGAVDVARRALGPRRLVAPQELVENRSLDRGGLLAAALANLLPGSLVHRIDADSVGIHSLSPDIDAPGSWRELQARLAKVMTRQT